MSPPEQQPKAARAPGRAARWEVRPNGSPPGHGIFGDGRPLHTPEGKPLVVPSVALAEAIAAELRAQVTSQAYGQAIAPKVPNIAAMPHLRLAATALDRVAAAREATIDGLVAYGGTELLCYRAEHPAELVERQQAEWQPLLDWAAARYDALLLVKTGIMPGPQSPAALAALRAAVAGYDDWLLTALAFAVQTSGSLIIGLALAEGRLDADQAFAAAELDESYQIERWGEDAEAAARRAQRRRDLRDAAEFMVLYRNRNP